MRKQTKLTEKATRIPDMRQMQWDETISQYLHDVEPLNKESARSHRFGMVVKDLLGCEAGFIEMYVSGIEKYLKVKQKDRFLKGEVDNLFGNIVIEFEVNILKKRAEAEEQLRRYVAIIWSQETPSARRPYLCIATDGVRFVTYSPTLAYPATEEVSPDDVHLQVLEEADWTKLKTYEAFYWLDRYFLRKEILHPTSETIVHDFGARSHAFQTTTKTLLTLWQEIKAQSAFAVIYDSWEKYLRIVYGSEVADDELFIRHTYLATLAKLMAWMRLTGNAGFPDDAQIVEMLEGRLFKDHGIENFIEEDFFSWLARAEAVKAGVGVVRWLFSLLQNYNLPELSEDVLKSLYQELVDPATRHDLGEFYTPDWLAHRIVRRLLDINPNGIMLDPACGSGTFLYLAIREKRERLGDSLETLRHILESVYGADIHPLAVIVAKTNYILAMGDLLKKRKECITIPIYLADTIKLPERWGKIGDAEYEVRINGSHLYLPDDLLDNLALYDQAIELTKEFARQNKGRSISLEPFRNFLMAQHFSQCDNDALARKLYAIAEVLKHFIDTDRDTIWAFILKNIYKPLFLKYKFDFVMGNPPWLAFGFAEPQYQKFLKEEILKTYCLLSRRGGQVMILSHLELGILFLLRAADLYLKEGGTIAFVLPRSIFNADQHDGFRQATFKNINLEFQEVWDLDEVTPLFNVPACSLIAKKQDNVNVTYPVSGQKLSGRLHRRNASLNEAEEKLSLKYTEIHLHNRGVHSFWAEGPVIKSKGSFYRSHFSQGAFIVPRSLWFVEVDTSPLGFNPLFPLVETSEYAKKGSKEAYKGLVMRGNVESMFLYATLLSSDLLPFGHLNYRLLVLPVEPSGNGYRLVNIDEARKRGFSYLLTWLEKAQAEWKKRRREKAEKMDIYGRLDQFHILSRQNPYTKYRVLYNTSGTFMTAAVVENEQIEFEINEQRIVAHGFVADTVTYFYETSNREEASYLLALLNAPIIDKLVKPMQARGLWGPRHFHKKVLELPIPQFDSANPTHRLLAELGEACSINVERWLAEGGAGNIKSIGRLRGIVRNMLSEEIREIDTLVKSLLEAPE